jgi:NAD(P)-dependent dehydrogenase (short-subunit alcohol dehydrogenase family)
MKSFSDKIAVITGGGTGMGREIARQLAASGCHVAICDVSEENMAKTRALCEVDAPAGVKITTHLADVSVEADVMAFRDAVMHEQETDCVHLVFNNAGIGGVGSFVPEERESWERTFNVCWYGVYYGTRAFLPLLLAAEEGHLINTSSVNGFWATLGPDTSHTAYSAAKFAVKGFTEGLINDLRANAPHVKVSVVMPGHVGTSIVINSSKILGTDPKEMSQEELEELRTNLTRRGVDLGGATPEDLRQALVLQGEAFRDDAPITAAAAAKIILDGVRHEKWRILVGDDAHVLDRLVREDPENAYTAEFMERLLAATNWRLGSLAG